MFITRLKRSPFYLLVYLENGKRKSLSTKTTDLKEAQKFLENFASPQPEIINSPEPSNSITLQSFCDEYSIHVSQTKSKDYVRSIKLSFKMLIEFTGDISLSSLEHRMLDKFFTLTFARTQRGASLYYRTLKASLSTAVLWNYLDENPLKKIKLAKVSKSFPMFINTNELKSILGKTNESYLRELYVVAFYTGMRLGELVNMQWNWIDFSKNLIKVKLSDSFITKSRKERIIPMNSFLKKLLLLRKSLVSKENNESYVFFRTQDSNLSEFFVSKKFKTAVNTAKLDDKIHFHTLRHSFASVLVQKGVSLYVVKELLGHESLTTTQVYSHLQQQNLRDAVNLL